MTKKLKWVANDFKELKLDRIATREGQTPAEAIADREEWRSQFVVGDPMGNDDCSVSELKAMGLIGLYKEVEN